MVSVDVVLENSHHFQHVDIFGYWNKSNHFRKSVDYVKKFIAVVSDLR